MTLEPSKLAFERLQVAGAAPNAFLKYALSNAASTSHDSASPTGPTAALHEGAVRPDHHAQGQRIQAALATLQ